MLSRRDLLKVGAAETVILGAAVTPSQSADSVSSLTRELITEPRGYYVRIDGDDENDGLADTSDQAFRTPQRAWNEISQRVDIGGQSVAIIIGPGTYYGGISDAYSPLVGGRVLIIGNPDNPGSVVIAGDDGDCIEISDSVVTVRGLKLSNTNGSCIHVYRSGVVNIEKVDFGYSNEAHIFVDNEGQAIISDDYRIVGSAPIHWSAHTGGLITGGGRAISLVGTPNFSTAFAYALRGGIIEAVSYVFTGASTGLRFIVDNNGTIFTGNNSASIFPGNAPGKIHSGTYGDDATGPIGNFSPTYQGRTAAGSTTYSNQYGRYTKVGPLVFISGTVAWTAATGSGQASIGNLPFPANEDVVVDILYSNLSIGAGKQGRGYLISGEGCIGIYACDPAGGPNASVPMEANGEIRFTATYTTNS